MIRLPRFSAHPRESGDPGVLSSSAGANKKPPRTRGLGPRFRGGERGWGLARSLGAALLALLATPALAGQPVTLNAYLVDTTGQVTLGELFDDAGAAAGVVVAPRT